MAFPVDLSFFWSVRDDAPAGDDGPVESTPDEHDTSHLAEPATALTQRIAMIPGLSVPVQDAPEDADAGDRVAMLARAAELNIDLTVYWPESTDEELQAIIEDAEEELVEAAKAAQDAAEQAEQQQVDEPAPAPEVTNPSPRNLAY